MATNYFRTHNGATIYTTANKDGFGLMVFSRGVSVSFSMDPTDARTLAERIINSLDNFQLTTTKE